MTLLNRLWQLLCEWRASYVMADVPVATHKRKAWR